VGCPPRGWYSFFDLGFVPRCLALYTSSRELGASSLLGVGPFILLRPAPHPYCGALRVRCRCIVASLPRHLGHGVLAHLDTSALRKRVVSWLENKRRRQRVTTFVVAHFLDAPCGPPTFWVPPCVLSSSIHPSGENEPAHIHMERGRGTGCGSSWSRPSP